MAGTETDLFILTAGAADLGGACRLLYWCTGPRGAALVRISGHRPLFFVARDARLPDIRFAERRSLELSSMDGRDMDGLYFKTLADFREARKCLDREGIQSWEADVRAEDRFLMERFISGSVRVSGPGRRENRITVFENPRLAPSEWRPQLTLMSLDIETGRDGTLYSVAVDCTGTRGGLRRSAVLDPLMPLHEAVHIQPDKETPDQILRLPGEADLLRFFIDAVRDVDPDVIIGWHVIGFDLAFLAEKSRRLGMPLRIGRGPLPLRISDKPGSLPIAELQGRLIIDGPPALRGGFYKFSDWRLGTVARELLGRDKEISLGGREKVDEIERRFREDKAALARYNIEDAVLVTEIFQRTGVLDQLITRSLITGLPADQVHRSVAAFDRFFLPRLHRKGRTAPNQADVTAGGPTPGAMVFTSGAGLFEDVAVLDFKSLYPTLIQTFHIDPYSLIRAEGDPLENPCGTDFSRSEHILPAYLSELMTKRSEAKAAGDEPLAEAVKIMMNAMYGVMGSPGCRFYRPELPSAITGIGRWALESTAERLRDRGYNVLYGDTDSVFVGLKTEERQNADRAGAKLAREVNEWFRETIRRDYGIASCLELEYEKRYLRLFLPAMRTGAEGAVKRYAGLLANGEVEIKGMEFVRSDSTPLAREFQYELFRRYFAGEDIKSWIRDMVRRLRAGEFDRKLVYRRRLSRPAREYKSPPPHVKAVKKLDPDGRKDLREVSYLVTPDGPVPVELNPKEIDYNHYIEKQLRSLADDVLAQGGDSFDAVLGGEQPGLPF